MFNKILIANRGEIACRIMRTAKKLGIKTVAIYSAADAQSPHVLLADEAYFVGAAPAKASYLNINAIINIAKQSHAEAIHPGYGFLSENPLFAKACEQENIIFIGPSVAAMEAMASKQLAKQLLEKTTVPLTPGYHGTEQSDAALFEAAENIGYPVLIKAAAGGGGKGMRAVAHKDDFHQALASARREALASFADDTMIIEKLVRNPRHIEVQIMADNFGHVVHLFERDCSIQRRHQKIIEEAPAPMLADDVRQGLAYAACEVARSIAYRGAGTVEFLVDGQHYYFMEMNTRLQVEHPVTEMITGLDLVAWQIQIAANQPLPLTQEQIYKKGHAIECRIYAEDAEHDFIPSIGTITYLQEPVGDGVRIDTGIVPNSVISQYYDPMIAKLIAYGDNRLEALGRLQQALAHYFVDGVKTNIPYLQAICALPRFAQAHLSTGFLDEETINSPTPEKEYMAWFAVGYDYCQKFQQQTDPLVADCFAWQMHLDGASTYRYLIDGELTEFKVRAINGQEYQISIDEKTYVFRCQLEANKIILQNDKQCYQAFVHEHNEELTFFTSQGKFSIRRYQWQRITNNALNENQLTAPMPATVVAILKEEGATVKKGDSLLVLEAMKMEHTIHAPKDGILTELFYTVGSQVSEGAELLKLS